ncbi:biotin--[acetyl-CoA-carboxylase] ligase [Winogradskyella sp. J14-2]|uniref:biotin--[acetyl-CoA-carboxylase] ligase n=1 Tax=Winogradskyella sp. J14-2 TaxID=1936080 RepID=UPI000972DBDE|nr:biotin--[acetyl-CoA-carboxylase] ligase [Winogradskyella sp. J14-2]APY09036.1 biotin--[acetyl-CoA-carboxylase] ligase [Winogradskyella sp. J14-2]
MYIIKLNAIDSTNSYLKALTSTVMPKDFTVVVANHQTKGRGQMGTVWQTEEGKNLTASVFKEVSALNVEKQFYISMVVALAICKTLRQLKIPQLSIKWPNDILSANKKICGTLIENVIKQNKLKGSVIGFGLNVNQKNFEGLPMASSMNLITGVLFNKDEVLSAILTQLQFYFKLLDSKDYAEIKKQYEALLFRKDKPSTFKNEDGSIFSGIIKGITETGKLNVWTEDGIVKNFDLKEVTLLY